MKNVYDEVLTSKKGLPIFKKDSNKLGGKKQRLASLNYREALWKNATHNLLEREAKHLSKLKPFFNYDCTGRKDMLLSAPWGIEDRLTGGFKPDEMSVFSAVNHHDDIRAHIGIGMLGTCAFPVDSSKIMLVGLEQQHREISRIVTESLKLKNPMVNHVDDPKRINFHYGERPDIMLVDDIPYNPMDEFDRPWMYDKDMEVAKLVSERFIPVTDDNHKYMYTFGNMGFNQTKPYYLEAELEEGMKTGKEWYKDLPGVKFLKRKEDNEK